MKYAEKKDIYLVLCLLLGVVIATLIAVTLICNIVVPLSDKVRNPLICVPQIRETIQGDIYTMTCFSKEEYDEIYNTEITQKPTDTI